MTTSIFGSVVHRLEDPRFLTGNARFTEAMRPEGALRAVFVRSIIAHGRISGVDVAAARAMPGVAAVLLASDLDLASQPPAGNVEGPFARPVLASDVVRFVGEPVALVLADSLARAQDAAEAVVVDVEPLEPVVGPDAAIAEDAPLLFPQAGSNLAHEFRERWDDDVLAGADVVVRTRVVHQRLAPVPLETNAVVARPEDDGVAMWVSTQVPFDVRDDVAEWLGLPRDAVRVVAPDVGGGFGTKLRVYPEYLAVGAAARRLGRAVAWQETRSESMTALAHGRAQVHDVELGATRDGILVGMRVDVLADMGAYPQGAYLPATTKTMLPGVYRIPHVAARGRSVVTNAVPVGEYRGAGRPEAIATVERAVDLLAVELGLDPVELRRRNLIPPEAFPFTSAVGSEYDTGDYGAALDLALRLAGYDELRREQAERRERGEALALGVGVALYVEVTGFGRKELGAVEVDEDGAALVRVGTTSTGQGHETAFAQVASGVLGIPVDRVRVVHSDTAEVQRGEGTFGSRSLQVGGTAVFRAAEQVLERARELAATSLEVAPEDVVVTEDGRLGVAGSPDTAVSWAEVAALAGSRDGSLAAEVRPFQRSYTFPFGAHVAVVEVDRETGAARVLDYVSVDDCGVRITPNLVRGQVHGGLAQGIAQALWEEVVYAEDGQLMTGSLMDYAVPRAEDLPTFRDSATVTPSPRNPLGAKGIGEAATIGSTPAVVNAVVDALRGTGVRHRDMPLRSASLVGSFAARS
jgi:carbon-monoxide dehydrogenase large subunit